MEVDLKWRDDLTIVFEFDDPDIFQVIDEDNNAIDLTEDEEEKVWARINNWIAQNESYCRDYLDALNEDWECEKRRGR